jgi:site-specific DNA recombinase
MRPKYTSGSPSGGLTQSLLYRRVSSQRQEAEGLSLDAQAKALREYSERQGWQVGGEYTDVESGTHDDREHYQRMLTDARRLVQAGHPVSVAVVKLDRLGRRLLERVRSREELKALGVETHSVLEGGRVSDLVANILGSVAEEEVR